MAIVFAGLAPHPPIMVRDIGKGEVSRVDKSIKAMKIFAAKLKNSGAESVVIISPHGIVTRDGIVITIEPEVEGSFVNFGSPHLIYRRRTDILLAQEISRQAAHLKVATIGIDKILAREHGIDLNLDHGVLVPLSFLDEAGISAPVVNVAMGILPFEELYAFGVAVKKASEVLDKKVAVVASGDMSHRLTPDSPYGEAPEGKIFDSKMVELLKNKDIKGIINIDRNLAEDAGECGLRPVIMMLGSLDGYNVESEILSYEGPFGIGYLVASFLPTGEGESFLEEIYQVKTAKVERKGEESIYVTLAREALENYVLNHKKIGPPQPLPKEFRDRAGVFVSLKKNGELRGCIGTTEPTRSNLAEEIIQNAISAGTQDPRFWPVEEDELDDITYSVDILSPPEPVDSIDQLDPKRYGVIVRSGYKSGLLLPNLEGIDTVEEQVAIAKRKAGIEPGEPVRLERFEVKRYY